MAQLVQPNAPALKKILLPSMSAQSERTHEQLVDDVLQGNMLGTFAQHAMHPTDELDRQLRDLEAHYHLLVRLHGGRAHAGAGHGTPYAGSPLMGPLCLLAQDPRRMQLAFLPTMPSDDMFEVRNAIQARGEYLHYYFCQNGHAYAVGISLFASTNIIL